jgi:hypothetical protein
MKSPTKSNHVLKSLDQLSPDLLGAKAARPEKAGQHETQALIQETKQQSIRPGFPTVSEMRGYRGWGINE